MNESSLRRLVKEKFLPPNQEVGAVLLVGSTAVKSKLRDWDDFDLQVYTRARPEWESHYEILSDSRKHHLVSAYYLQLDTTSNPKTTVMDQKDVRILQGTKESLRHIRVDRPRRIEPLPHELKRFEARREVFFNILVDIFFILNRYEARGRPSATKPRIARIGLRTICRHFHQFYGVEWPISKKEKWKTVLKDTVSLLRKRGYEDECQNREFVRAAISLMGS